jgi:hypothetical protein
MGREAVGQLTVGCSMGRPMIAAVAQRKAAKAGLVAAWSGFALAVSPLRFRFGGIGSAAVVVEASVPDPNLAPSCGSSLLCPPQHASWEKLLFVLGRGAREYVTCI